MTVFYSMSVSLDGYIAGPDSSFDWTAPGEELHRFHNERVRELDAHLLGRRLYETMVYWEGDDPARGEVEHEFTAIWRALPKIVLSTTLQSVEGNTKLARGDLAAELDGLAGSRVAIGGAGLAAEAARLDLIDEYELFVYPVIVGGGTPFFPPLDRRLDLELAETRTFASRVQYLRYSRVRSNGGH